MNRLLTGSLAPPPNRAEGRLSATFRLTGRGTAVERTHESGGLRLRFPKVRHGPPGFCDAVCINTAGGMVGGDAANYAFALGPGAQAAITTQSAEKIYRAENQATTAHVSLTLAAGACAHWIPQETILFDGVRLHRRIEAELPADATLLIAESLVFGRLAMGEIVRFGDIRDRWRVRRDGRLVYAEDLRLDGPVADLLARPAIGRGARAIATLLLVSPEAESRLGTVRTALADLPAEAGASAWNGLLAVRAVSPSPDRLRASILGVLQVLRGCAAPRVWQ